MYAEKYVEDVEALVDMIEGEVVPADINLPSEDTTPKAKQEPKNAKQEPKRAKPPKNK